MTHGAIFIGVVLRDGLSRARSGARRSAGQWSACWDGSPIFPFYVGFQSQLGGVLPNLLAPSRFSQFFVMFGPFLVMITLYMALLVAPCAVGLARRFLIALPVTLLAPLVLAGLVTLFLGLMPQGRADVAGPAERPGGAAACGRQPRCGPRRLRRPPAGCDPVDIPGAGAVIGLGHCASSGRWPRARGADAERSLAQPLDVADMFAVLMIGLALLLTLTVEFAYLRDLFGTRMNTVFKLYYQAWVLLALASAYGLGRLVASEASLLFKVPAVGFAALLIVAGLIYPVAATPNKANAFAPEPTLDGLAFMRASRPAEIAAIEWMRANVHPAAVVVESSGGSYSPEGAGRVSMSTGNPTLLGWDFHEMQWRGDAYGEVVAGRPEALDQIYRLAPTEELTGLLDRWGVDFVYVGDLERDKFGVSDATLSRFDRVLRRVYDRDGVIIYAR